MTIPVTSPKIFISYSRTDTEYATHLTKELLRRGYLVWLDRTSVQVGDEFMRKIARGIQEADAVVVLMSEAAEKSDWVPNELLIAKKLNKPILPITLDGYVLMWLLTLNYVTLNGDYLPDESFFQALDAVSRRAASGTGTHEPTAVYLLPIVQRVFASSPLKPFIGGTTEETLRDTWKRIYLSQLCIFDLTEPAPTLFIEAGIALAMNKPCIFVSQTPDHTPAIIGAEHVLLYQSEAQLEALLAQHASSELLEVAHAANTRYCPLCNRVCESLYVNPDMNTFLVLSNSRMLWGEVSRTIAPAIQKHHVFPIYLTDVGTLSLCAVRRKIRSSQFAVAHLGKLSDANCQVALGLAIGSLTPWLVLNDAQSAMLPIIFDQPDISVVSYEALDHLVGETPNALEKYLDTVLPTQSSRERQQDPTLMMTVAADSQIPFWIEMRDWIRAHSPQQQTQDDIQPPLRVMRLRNHQVTDKHMLHPTLGLRFGRDRNRCDVILDSPQASKEHFRVIEGQDGKYYVQDLGSSNGTFLQGKRLLPNQLVELKLKHEIRVAGATFIIWDDRPLLPEMMIDSVTPPQRPDFIHIDFPEIPPPPEYKTWDHKIVLRAMFEDIEFTFETQGYYTFEAIIGGLREPLHLRPNLRYYVARRGTTLDERDTPLSMMLSYGDSLQIVVDPLDFTIERTRERIKNCDSFECQGLEDGKPSWRYGRKFGSYRELFTDTYRTLFGKLPPRDVELPLHTCPSCHGRIGDDTVVGI
ncbi:MAG: TIR domain-containing protein [Chloroflexota bacterium]|nr:TIR domain-containing protein [Chloroflexota bacterium]